MCYYSFFNRKYFSVGNQKILYPSKNPTVYIPTTCSHFHVFSTTLLNSSRSQRRGRFCASCHRQFVKCHLYRGILAMSHKLSSTIDNIVFNSLSKKKKKHCFQFILPVPLGNLNRLLPNPLLMEAPTFVSRSFLFRLCMHNLVVCNFLFHIVLYFSTSDSMHRLF